MREDADTFLLHNLNHHWIDTVTGFVACARSDYLASSLSFGENLRHLDSAHILWADYQNPLSCNCPCFRQRGFFELFDSFLGFLFGRMRDYASWTNVFTASTENDTSIGVYYGSFFALYLFKLKGTHVTEINTFSTGNTFFIVDFWVPKYFFSGDPFVCFFF
jgi:hypothetical protein